MGGDDHDAHESPLPPATPDSGVPLAYAELDSFDLTLLDQRNQTLPPYRKYRRRAAARPTRAAEVRKYRRTPPLPADVVPWPIRGRQPKHHRSLWAATEPVPIVTRTRVAGPPPPPDVGDPEAAAAEAISAPAAAAAIARQGRGHPHRSRRTAYRAIAAAVVALGVGGLAWRLVRPQGTKRSVEAGATLPAPTTIDRFAVHSGTAGVFLAPTTTIAAAPIAASQAAATQSAAPQAAASPPAPVVSTSTAQRTSAPTSAPTPAAPTPPAVVATPAPAPNPAVDFSLPFFATTLTADLQTVPAPSTTTTAPPPPTTSTTAAPVTTTTAAPVTTTTQPVTTTTPSAPDTTTTPAP
jgi:hypothetical protein